MGVFNKSRIYMLSIHHPYFDLSVQQDKHESPGDTWLVVVCPSTELMRWNFEISSWVLPWETHPWTCFPLRLNFNELEAELQIMILLDLDSGQVPQTASQLTLKQYCWWFHCIEFFKFNIRNRLFWYIESVCFWCWHSANVKNIKTPKQIVRDVFCRYRVESYLITCFQNDTWGLITGRLNKTSHGTNSEAT